MLKTLIYQITTVLYEKINEVENKTPDYAMLNILINKLTAEYFTARLKQADLVEKIDFDYKLIRFNRKVTPNKTKYLEVQKKLNSVITKDYNSFLGIIYFTNNYGFQNMFFFINRWYFRIKRKESADYVLSWKLKGVYNFKYKSL